MIGFYRPYSLLSKGIANSTVMQKIGVNLLSFGNMLQLLMFVYLVLGIGIGTLGSSISMRKYLKV